MRTSVLLLLLAFPFALHAAEYGPAQVLNALRQLREQRGDTNPPKLAVCLKNSSDGRWTDLQAHFYCWLKADQRACFTGAVDGEFKDHAELKGNYDQAFAYCQEAKGRAYGINFDRPLSRLTAEQGEVFKNLVYRKPMLTKDEQRKILENFYAGTIPQRKAAAPMPVPAPIATPAPAPTPKTAPVPPSLSASSTMVNPDLGDEDDAAAIPEGYPRSCSIKTPHARTRLKPDSSSPVVAVLDAAPIKVMGPPQSSTGGDTLQWYPVEFHYRGNLTSAWLAVSLIDCPK